MMNRVLNRRFSAESLAQCHVFSSGSGERSSPSPWPRSRPQVPWYQSDVNPDRDGHQLLTQFTVSDRYKNWVKTDLLINLLINSMTTSVNVPFASLTNKKRNKIQHCSFPSHLFTVNQTKCTKTCLPPLNTVEKLEKYNHFLFIWLYITRLYKTIQKTVMNLT